MRLKKSKATQKRAPKSEVKMIFPTISVRLSDTEIDPSMDPIVMEKKIKKLRHYIAKLDTKLSIYQSKHKRLSTISEDEQARIRQGLLYFNEASKNESAV